MRRRAAALEDADRDRPGRRLKQQAQGRGRGFQRRLRRTKQQRERRPTLGRDRKPAQLRIARAPRPEKERCESARAQRLLGCPERVAPPGRAHHDEKLQRHARGGERRRIRQVRRRDPRDAPAACAHARERRQYELQLADALAG